MAIKRLTIELDDVPESQGPTNVPVSLAGGSKQTSKETQGRTEVTEYSSEVEAEAQGQLSAPSSHPVFGRTVSDLVAEFINNPRAMATLLTFIPFVVFVTKIDSIESLKFPIIVGLILNTVWFGVAMVTRIFNFFGSLTGSK